MSEKGNARFNPKSEASFWVATAKRNHWSLDEVLAELLPKQDCNRRMNAESTPEERLMFENNNESRLKTAELVRRMMEEVR